MSLLVSAETVQHRHVPTQRAPQQGKLGDCRGFRLQLMRGQADEMLDLADEVRMIVEAAILAQLLPAMLV